MKRIYALIAAVIITGVVGLGMLAIGLNATFNPNSVAAANAPAVAASAASPAASPSGQNQAQVQQLQSLISQYQSREQQYQARLSQDEAQLQQYQTLLSELQRRGLIRVNSDGSIQLPRRGLANPDD